MTTSEIICHDVNVAINSNSTSAGRKTETKEEKEFAKKINAFLKKPEKNPSKKWPEIQYQAVPINNKSGETIAVKHCALVILH